jgi:uncharacterized membrane protein YdjX (TVP38/TMEM64 family)
MDTVPGAQPRVKTLVNILSVLGIAAVIALGVLGYRAGLFTSGEALSAFLARAGILAPIFFMLLQVIQVVIPILPGTLGCLAGVVIFGPVWGFVYNYAGVVVGSTLNFLFARKFGKPFVQGMIPEKAYQKYIGWLDRGGAFDKWFALAIFLPVAPDDYLCLLAGMTRMTLKRFVAIIVLGKPCSILAYSYGLTALYKWVAGLIGWQV